MSDEVKTEEFVKEDYKYGFAMLIILLNKQCCYLDTRSFR